MTFWMTGVKTVRYELVVGWFGGGMGEKR